MERFVFGLLPSGLVVACSISMDPEALRPTLTQAIADPVVLAQVCRSTPDAVGPISASRLTLSSISAKRPLVGSAGTGTAEVEYRPVGGSLSETTCRGRLSFDFSDDASASHFTFRNLRLVP